jgi:transposase-like protein
MVFAIKECPYCKAENQIETKDWERVKCPSCKGVFYAQVVSEIEVSAFDDKGKDVDFTLEG